MNEYSGDKSNCIQRDFILRISFYIKYTWDIISYFNTIVEALLHLCHRKQEAETGSTSCISNGIATSFGPFQLLIYDLSVQLLYNIIYHEIVIGIKIATFLLFRPKGNLNATFYCFIGKDLMI